MTILRPTPPPTHELYLRHPLYLTLSPASAIDYYMRDDKPIGLRVQFPDGHTVDLTYAEIRGLTPPNDDDDSKATPKPCPVCKSPTAVYRPSVGQFVGQYLVMCPTAGCFTGPYRPTRALAIAAWDEGVR